MTVSTSANGTPRPSALPVLADGIPAVLRHVPHWVVWRYVQDDWCLVGVDMDHCRDPVTDELQPWADWIVRRLDSYTEAPPSIMGIPIIDGGFWY